MICKFYLKRGVSRQRYSRLLEFSTSTPSTFEVQAFEKTYQAEF